jgi:hypothetical protein
MTKYLCISSNIRKPFLIHQMICNLSTLNFLIYEENFIFLFISVARNEVQQLNTIENDDLGLSEMGSFFKS